MQRGWRWMRAGVTGLTEDRAAWGPILLDACGALTRRVAPGELGAAESHTSRDVPQVHAQCADHLIEIVIDLERHIGRGWLDIL